MGKTTSEIVVDKKCVKVVADKKMIVSVRVTYRKGAVVFFKKMK